MTFNQSFLFAFSFTSNIFFFFSALLFLRSYTAFHSSQLSVPLANCEWRRERTCVNHLICQLASFGRLPLYHQTSLLVFEQHRESLSPSRLGPQDASFNYQLQQQPIRYLPVPFKPKRFTVAILYRLPKKKEEKSARITGTYFSFFFSTKFESVF